MSNAVKILNSVLIVFAVFMGIKQGYAMFTGQPEMLQLFAQWDFTETGVKINGVITLLAALLILHPKTFLWGNLIMGAGIFMILCFQLIDGNISGAAMEVPFLLLNLVIIYLRHPFAKPKQP